MNETGKSGHDATLTRAIEKEGATGYTRIIEYARRKGYDQNSELWPWADVLGFSAQIFGEIPGQITKSGNHAASGVRDEITKVGGKVVEDIGKLSQGFALRVGASLDSATERLEKVAKGELREETEKAVAAVSKASEKAGDAILQAIAKEVATFTQAESRMKRLPWAAFGAVAIFASIALGFALGYTASRTWGEGAEIGAGQKLAELKEADKLAHCRGAGWKVLQREIGDELQTICVPAANGKEQVGWVIGTMPYLRK